MGEFISAQDMRAHGLIPLIAQLETDVLDTNFIVPAERLIEEACALNLDTDAEPWHWSGTFENRPDLLANFRADYRRCVIMTVNRMAANPLGMGSQSVGGASGAYGGWIPPEVKAIMRRWGATKRLFRT